MADEEFVDRITFKEMDDPFVLSSGHVYDKSTLLDADGKLKIDECPITRAQLEPKVYPYAVLKSKITSQKIARLNQLILIANSFKNDETKFNMAIE